MLTKLTLVMPTYKRQAFALRGMRYWSGRGPEVLVMDGSPRAISPKALDGLSENVRYIHSPTLADARLRKACEIVRTKYTSLLADDEFHIPSSLEASLIELENDESLVSCMGRAIGFDINSSGKAVGFEMYPALRNYVINGHTSKERTHENMRNYVPSTIYSVVRTGVWRDSCEPMFRKSFSILGIGELQFAFSISFFGRSKIIPTLHWLRSSENTRISDSPDPSVRTKNKFYEWWLSPKHRAFREEFLEVTASVLAEASGRPEYEVAGELEEAMNEYAEFCLSIFKKSKPPADRRLSFFSLRYARSLLKTYRKRWHKPIKKNVASRHLLLDEAKHLAATGVAVDFEQLEEIKTTIEEFHQQGAALD